MSYLFPKNRKRSDAEKIQRMERIGIHALQAIALFVIIVDLILIYRLS